MMLDPASVPHDANVRAPGRQTSGGSGSRDGASFAGILLHLDRALGARTSARTFGGGTMPQSVDVFNAHGFFAGSAPSATPDVSSRPEDRNGGSTFDERKPSSSSLSSPGMKLLGQGELVPASAGLNIAIAVQDGPGPEFTERAPLSAGVPRLPFAAEAKGVEPKFAGPAPAPVSSPCELSAPPSSPAPTGSVARRSAVASSSQFKVALDIGTGRAVVSVTGGGLAANEAEELHDAVSRLLARHGLVLSELRVARRSADHDQQKGTE